ncbi:MAG: hypothetical protein HGB18_05015 [Candidatus Moranbacteria bacterium]|nr:hypothetical protein [Candidatus Moranbacteria bacterium]
MKRNPRAAFPLEPCDPLGFFEILHSVTYKSPSKAVIFKRSSVSPHKDPNMLYFGIIDRRFEKNISALHIGITESPIETGSILAIKSGSHPIFRYRNPSHPSFNITATLNQGIRFRAIAAFYLNQRPFLVLESDDRNYLLKSFVGNTEIFDCLNSGQVGNYFYKCDRSEYLFKEEFPS